MFKRIFVIAAAALITTFSFADTININNHHGNKSFGPIRGIEINNINDVVKIDGPFYETQVTVFPDRYSNPNLPSDPVVLECNGKLTKIMPGKSIRCGQMADGKAATVRIDPADFKLGADIEVFVVVIGK